MTAAGTIPDALAHFTVLPDDAQVRFPVVEALLSASTSTIWRRIKDDPDFPKPLRDGRRTSFRVGDLRRYLIKKAA
ncbi:MAG: AlpA family phage regulatory protein [Sterolibacteriaceae bacterium]|uniref:AlpA family phage regulatory protein n=1 Tax=Candidatus Methylophosphatis roskildensis TaxID=2899263 RepID=A0A9D7E2R8_9PROT|nr:AlpA family phage regulatory protein [Candidatus Methylophosphatis roskildensis]MBK7235818.1 AlpA family phage regulatory protein [Sterolibacteriaceae bacterium]